MVRGYLTSTVGRSINPARLEIIRRRAEARAGNPPKTGFLSRSSDILDLEGQTRSGSGEIKYTLHSRSHTKPYYTDVAFRKLRLVVEKYVRQVQIDNFAPPERILALTSGISFNGKSWKIGSGCLFYLDDDARGQEHPRVGKVQRFLVVEVDEVEEYFVDITEHNVLRWHRSVAVVDLSRPVRNRITHAGHVVSLAAYAEYWQPRFTQYKCVVRVADTY
jgi:hypothetical protein